MPTIQSIFIVVMDQACKHAKFFGLFFKASRPFTNVHPVTSLAGRDVYIVKWHLKKNDRSLLKELGCPLEQTAYPYPRQIIFKAPKLFICLQIQFMRTEIKIWHAK